MPSDEAVARFMEAFGITADTLIHPSGECRCTFPGSNVSCRLPWDHDGDHDGGPIRLVNGEMSKPLTWPQSRPAEERM